MVALKNTFFSFHFSQISVKCEVIHGEGYLELTEKAGVAYGILKILRQEQLKEICKEQSEQIMTKDMNRPSFRIHVLKYSVF